MGWGGGPLTTERRTPGWEWNQGEITLAFFSYEPASLAGGKGAIMLVLLDFVSRQSTRLLFSLFVPPEEKKN